jgi:spore coat protein U-like protein
MNVTKRALLIMTAVGFPLLATPVSAGNTTTTLTVSATVVSACNWGTSSYTANFGTIDPTSGFSEVDTSLAITCTNGTSVTVDASGGDNQGGTAASPQRAMKGSATSTLLHYGLALPSDNSAPPFASNWGDAGATPTAGVNYTFTASGASQSIPVRVATGGGQTVPPDSYTDHVTFTAWF